MYFKYTLIKLIAITIGFQVLWSCKQNAIATPETVVKHVVVIGIDGMSPQGIRGAQTPNLDSLIAQGAYTYQMRAVLPTSSGPNWASMIMGADVEQHGITSNSWTQNNYQLPAVVHTIDNKFPSIFDVIKTQSPHRKTAAIYDWGKFGRYLNEAAVDINIDGDHEDGTTASAIDVIKKERPDFTFIHLDHVDHAGHAYGHDSKAYYQSIEKADNLIAQIIDATKSSGMYNETLFIISADHGGRGFSHGGATLGEIEIPFIISGAGIKSNYTIKEAVYQYDNASTIAFAFGLKQPQPWIGRPIKSVFIGQKAPELQYQRHTTKAPIIHPQNDSFTPSGGIYEAAVTVNIENPNAEGSIYYTLDGSVPTVATGVKYIAPFTLNETTVVKVGVFEDKRLVATIETAYFRVLNTREKEAHGVSYNVYNTERLQLWSSLKSQTPIDSGILYEFSSDPVLKTLENKEQVLITYQSYLVINTPGTYTFYTASDEDSLLFINGELLVNNNGKYDVAERGARIELEAGKHRLDLMYYNQKGFSHLSAYYEGPEVPKQLIPVTQLYRQ